MNLGDAGKNRRKQIKSLRSKRALLLDKRDLMKGRLGAQEQEVEKVNCRKAQLIELRNRIMSAKFFNEETRLRCLGVLEVVERQIDTLSEKEFEESLSVFEKNKPIIVTIYER